MKGNKYRKEPANNFNYRNGSGNRVILKKLLDAFKNQNQTNHKKQSGSEISGEKKRDWHDNMNLFIQAILAFFTAGLFYYTVIQLKEVRRSTDAAVKAADAAVKANDYAQKSYELSKKTFDSNSVSSARTLDIAAHSLETQNSSYREEQRRFAAQNQPYLHMNAFKLMPFVEGQPIEIITATVFSGSLPAQLLQAREGWQMTKDSIINPFGNPPASLSLYQMHDYVGQQPLLTSKKAGAATKELIAMRKAGYNFFFYGIIDYINPFNRKRMSYKFNVNITPDPDRYYYLVNENFPAKIEKAKK